MFTRNLSSQQQEERLERISQAIENQEAAAGDPLPSRSVISLQGRQLIESDQEEIKEAESRFLSPEEVGRVRPRLS